MIVAVCNQKGGVGKTFITTGLASRLTQAGQKVLVVDCDPQANATDILGVVVEPETLTLNDVLASVASGAGGAVAQAISVAGKTWGSIMVLPSERALASREADFSLGREARLRTALETVRDDFDVILLDCPPSLGMLTSNALVAADRALIVTEAGASAVAGVAEIVTTLATVRAHYNPQLSLGGILVNRFRPDRLDGREWLQVLQNDYGNLVYAQQMPEREAIRKSATRREPLDAPEVTAVLDVIAAGLTDSL